MRRILSILFVILAIGFVQTISADQEELVLITSLEAESLKFSDAEWNQLMAENWPDKGEGGLYYASKKADSIGPKILIQVPDVDENEDIPTIQALTPMDLLIVFEQTSMPVDMSSLYVVAKKGFFSKTLTERLEPYVSGTTIDAKGVKIPKGKFLIEVTIADQDGFKTTGSYLLKVNKGD